MEPAKKLVSISCLRPTKDRNKTRNLSEDHLALKCYLITLFEQGLSFPHI